MSLVDKETRGLDNEKKEKLNLNLLHVATAGQIVKSDSFPWHRIALNPLRSEQDEEIFEE